MLAEDTVGKIIMSGRRSRKGAARANVTKRHLREERRRQIEPLLARLWNDDPQRSARYYAPRIAAKLNVRGRTFKTETIRREIGPMVTELRKAAAVASRPRVRNV
jgi:hypothetical protein